MSIYGLSDFVLNLAVIQLQNPVFRFFRKGFSRNPFRTKLKKGFEMVANLETLFRFRRAPIFFQCTSPILTSTLNNSSNDSREKKIELSYKTDRIVTLVAQDLFYDFNKKEDRNSCMTADHIYTKPSHASDRSEKQKDQQNGKSQEDRFSHCAVLN